MRFALTIISFAILTLTDFSRADVLLEPVLGSKATTLKLGDNKSRSGSDTAYGVKFGQAARVGSRGAMQLGLDYLKTQGSGGGTYNSFNTHEWSAIAAVKFMGLRLYGGYTFSGAGELYDSANAQWIKLGQGQGQVIGISLNKIWDSFKLSLVGEPKQKVGFRPLEWINFGIESRKGTYGEVKNANVSDKSGAYSATVLYLSLQMTF